MSRRAVSIMSFDMPYGRMNLWILLVVGLCSIWPLMGQATTPDLELSSGLETPPEATAVYLAPQATVSNQEVQQGTRDHPFVHLGAAVHAVEAKVGSHIILMNGEYGNVTWRGIAPKTQVLIVPETPGGVHMERLILRQTRNLYIKGLSVWPNSAVKKAGVLVATTDHSANITFEGFDVRGRKDAPDSYYDWSAKDWLYTWRNNGFVVKGDNITLRDNTITAVAFGIQTKGRGARVINNKVLGFSGDAMRGLGDDSLFRGNYVQDCIDVDANHDDGFQSWSPKKKGRFSAVRNLILEENVIVEWAGSDAHPLHGRLQGIGLFDGIYDGFKIRNNLVVVDHYHGITMFGGRNSEISNNTVVRLNGMREGRPWIHLRKHRNGLETENVLVQDNLAMSYKNVPQALRHNAVVTVPMRIFKDPQAEDFRLRPKAGLGSQFGASEAVLARAVSMGQF